MPRSILFITTTNLSTNPRILKEIKLAISFGFNVGFIAFKLGNWSDRTENEQLKSFNNLKVNYIPATKKPVLPWILSSLICKAASILSTILKKNLKLHSYAHNKRTYLINNHFKKISKNYDLVIAHNLGALYPAYVFGKKNKIPFAFDLEDYHPGENCSSKEQKRREFLMKKLMPKANYLSYASPMIGEYSLKLIENHQIPPNFLINNCFSAKEFHFYDTNSEKVKLVWFSQNIAATRGLELILPALEKFKDKIEVHLIGNLYQDFYENFLIKFDDFIQIEKPMPQAELNQFVCNFDIGLAIELVSSDFNRDICLTNKIFTYAQAGLYIFATNTSAQKQFIEQNPKLGMISNQTIPEMEQNLLSIFDNIDRIRATKKERFDFAQNLAWEKESDKLNGLWTKNNISKTE
jgi:hypothetical protein